MIPVRVVVAAPLPIRVHSSDVVIDLGTMLAVMTGVAIDSGAICLKPALAIVFPVLVSASRTAESQHESTRQRGRQNHSTPQISRRHDRLLRYFWRDLSHPRPLLVSTLIPPRRQAGHQVKSVIRPVNSSTTGERPIGCLPVGFQSLGSNRMQASV